MRWALGITSFISLANWVRRLLGSLEVVTRTFGSRSPACAYSSSTCDLGTAVLSSSSAIPCRRVRSTWRSSVGIGLPSATAREHQFFEPALSHTEHRVVFPYPPKPAGSCAFVHIPFSPCPPGSCGTGTPGVGGRCAAALVAMF